MAGRRESRTAPTWTDCESGFATALTSISSHSDELERARGGDGAPSPAIWCMRETQLGVLRAESLAAAPSVACLVAGTSDLSTDLRCDGAWSERQALLPALSQIVLAARAHGAACLDGVQLDLDDAPALRSSCAQAMSGLGHHLRPSITGKKA